MPGVRKTPRRHYSGSYQTRAKRLRAEAYADPLTVCWVCGKTLHHWRPDDTWQAGHVIDGAVDGELRAEHRSCNNSRGGRRGWEATHDPGPSVAWT